MLIFKHTTRENYADCVEMGIVTYKGYAEYKKKYKTPYSC